MPHTRAPLTQLPQSSKGITAVRNQLESGNALSFEWGCKHQPHCNSDLLLQHRSQSFGVVFFPVLINIANQCKKNLPDLICQNTYGYRVKYVFLHFILDAKSVLGETWRAVSLRILTQKMSSPFCSLWNWLRTAFPQKPRLLLYSNLYSLEAGLARTPYMQLLSRYKDKLQKMKPKILFIVLPSLPKDKFCLLSLRGSTALAVQEKEGTKSTLIKYNQWVTNCAAVRNSKRLNKLCTRDHFVNTIALPYCFSSLFFLLIFVIW